MAAVYDAPCFRYFHWAPSPVPFSMGQVHAAYAWLDGVVAEHGPFDGVLGFSQGAVMAVALLLHRQRLRAAAEGEEEADDQHLNPPRSPADDAADAAPPPLPFHFAVLFACPDLPALLPDAVTVSWGRLRIPSLHVCGEADHEWFAKSRDTFTDRCEPGTALLLVHKGGHAVPGDRPTVDRVMRAIGALIRRAEEACGEEGLC